MDNNANIELLRGHMDTIILCTLMSGDKYGLEILKEIHDSSQELYTLKQPTLYSALKRLTADSLISSYDGDISNGRKRVYYSLTEKGRKFVTDDQLQWEFSRTIMDKLVSDKLFDPIMNERPFDPSEFRPSTKRTKSKSEEYDALNQDENDSMQNNNASTESSMQVSIQDDESTDDSCAAMDDNSQATQAELPCGVTSGAISSSAYNTESVIMQPQNVAIQPLKPVEEKSVDRFHFSSVVPPELKKQELLNRQGYHDVPASLDSLFDTKLEKSPIASIPSNPKPTMPKQQFSFSAAATTNHAEIDDKDRRTAANILYSDEYATAPQHDKSALPDSLTHYDLDITPTRSNKRGNDNTTAATVRVEQANMNTRNQNVSDANYHDIEKNTSPKYVQRNFQAEKDTVTPQSTPLAEEKSVNYISALGNIFNTSKTSTAHAAENKKNDLYTYDQNIKIPPTQSTKHGTAESRYVEDMNLAKLKSKLYDDDITLKQYVKSDTSSYYVNKYYYNNKLLRDWSYIAYAIFALFCIICYSSTIHIKIANLGAFLGIMFVGAAFPVLATVKWYMNKSARKSANFSFAHAMVTGAIVLTLCLIIILPVSFFAFKINVADIKTMINPFILPLVALLMIPIDITVYSLLYNSKRYHLR